MAAVLTHYLTKELQVVVKLRNRGMPEKQTPLWFFEELGILRH
jgi:hypothetical protein